jgi:hypothetical protein
VKLYLLVILLCLSPFAVGADLSFDQLERISKNPSSLEGRFNQEKYLAALDTSLHSSGIFSYQRGRSVRWETLKPIQSEMLITPAFISNKQGGQELMRMETQSSPAVALFNEIFFSVLTAEWGKLSAYFKLSGKLEGGQWHAELIPVDKTVKQVVSRVELKGDALVREIILHESGGDRTTIHFENSTP